MSENTNSISVDIYNNDEFYNDVEEHELIEREESDILNNDYSKNSSNFTVALVILFYSVISISVVYLNKFLVGKENYSFSYPFTLTLYQMLVALVLIFMFGELNKRSTQKSTWNPIPPFEFNSITAKKVAPLTLIYVGMLSLSNFCLTYSKITYYQVAKSLTIIFTIVFTFIILKKHHSKATILTCMVIFIGFILGNLGEDDFSWAALLSGIASSIFIALYGIYIKKTLNVLNDDEWMLLIYNTTMSIFILLPICLFTGEFYQAWNEYEYLSNFGFWVFMTIAGITGFLISIATFLAIKFTSPLTFTVMGTAKAGIQTVLAPFVFYNPVSTMNGIGISIVLIGSSFYSYIKYKESNSK